MKPKTYAVEYTHHMFPVRIVFAPNAKAWAEATRGADPTDPNPPYPVTPGRCSSWTFEGGLLIVLAIGDCEDRNALQTMGIMVHECMHAVQQVEDFIGIKFDAETEAYFMQDLTMWLFGAFVDAGRKTADTLEAKG